MRNRIKVILQVALMVLCGAFYGRTQGTFAEPRSTLLFSGTSLRLTFGKQELVLPNPPGLIGEGFSPLPLPALAPKGDLVAGTLAIPIDTEKRRAHLVIGVYSLLNHLWKTYGNFCFPDHASVAFSPDGTKVAFISKSKEGSANCESSPKLLRILDLVTGDLMTVPYPAKALMENARLSWSPDGRYLVAQSGPWASPPQHIVVIEVASGKGNTIAEGTDPSWSPKGDWIAYTADSRRKCMLIHSDGTGVKMLRDLSKAYRRDSWQFFNGAVWSPDGGRLLLNEYQFGVPGSLVVTMLDLSTGKVTKESQHGTAVYGWSPKAGD